MRKKETGSEYYKKGTAIQKALLKYDLKKPITVHRGDDGGLIPNGQNKTPAELKKMLKVGMEFTSNNFVSTSANSPFRLKPVQYNIKVPKGKRGAYVKGVSSFKNENEFLLKANTKYRVTKVTGGQKNNKIFVTLEIFD